ncbi:MAG: alpha/beta hydrolase [Chloroflexaceae bacterium]|nr:alpha/beta hydrolase [Chloroflexaceae bacterium]
MTSVIFVHGTGVRAGYDEDLALISAQLQKRRAGISVLPCHWADAALNLRAELGRGGVSVPRGRFARGEEEDTDAGVALWGSLYVDPLYELRLLAVLPPADEAVEAGSYQAELSDLAGRVATFTASAALSQSLEQAGLAAVFDAARGAVAGAAALERISSDGRHEPDLVRGAVTRAVIAAAIQQAQMAGQAPRAAVDADLRDGLVTRFSLELTGVGADRGAVELIKSGALALLGHGATWYLRRDAAIATHFAFPFSGDILRYWREGARIRGFVRDRIIAAPPPVYLLGHSLGGIICFDLLCLENLSERVAGLITIGSQAPLLYELDVLAGLPFGAPLPGHFPRRWLNLFDQRDLLSFVGAGLFPGQVEDVEVDNRQPFPNAHISYWSNARLWDAVSEWIGAG